MGFPCSLRIGTCDLGHLRYLWLGENSRVCYRAKESAQWKVLKELLRYEGDKVANSGSPREIIKAAYVMYDFIDEEIWISMLRERNNMTHIYDGNEAKELVKKIIDCYIPTFCLMKEKIENRYQEILDSL